MVLEEKSTDARAAAVAEGLLSALEKAVEELSAVVATRREKTKTDEGETVTEYQVLLPQTQGAVDRGALRQLVGVLKDMREIFGILAPGEEREQEARLMKLERELGGEETAGITVTWEGDTHDCAQ